MRIPGVNMALTALCVLLAAAPPALAYGGGSSETAANATRATSDLFRICENAGEENRDRCTVQQLMRQRRNWRHSKPTEAYKLYDRLNRGNLERKERIQQSRLIELRQHWTENRRTYADFQPTDDLNTRQHATLNDLRMQRLDCQKKPSPRMRKICFDELSSSARQQMKQAQESNQTPAQ